MNWIFVVLFGLLLAFVALSFLYHAVVFAKEAIWIAQYWKTDRSYVFANAGWILGGFWGHAIAGALTVTITIAWFGLGRLF